MYLTSIMDLYSRKMIAWKLTKTMEIEEVKMSGRNKKEEKNR